MFFNSNSLYFLSQLVKLNRRSLFKERVCQYAKKEEASIAVNMSNKKSSTRVSCSFQLNMLSCKVLRNKLFEWKVDDFDGYEAYTCL